VLDRLAALARQRQELDRTRETALELIFDAETYFYPYTPPECPAEKAKLYPAVQRRVDVLVGAVREVWAERRAVALPSAFRTALDELRWSESLHATLALPYPSSDELPDWLEGIDTALESLDVTTFAWDAGERRDLALDRAVRVLNPKRWRTETQELDRANPERVEERQVEITNDYRVMMGRRALAWHPKLQAAAQWHSNYMANTGNFGHMEPGDPEHYSPGDRMAAEGYPAGGGENAAMTGGGAEGAHVGWLHSSGHHRNILARGHREMASGVAGGYWTQNFGSGTDFKERLEEWHD